MVDLAGDGTHFDRLVSLAELHPVHSQAAPLSAKFQDRLAQAFKEERSCALNLGQVFLTCG